VWHRDFDPRGWDAVIIPGGFSYGDWLRAGAIAARTEAVERIADCIDRGIPVLGICNGFQILVEAGLLPGALLPNESGRFVCRWVKLVARDPRGPWLKLVEDGQVLTMPVAHAEGRYVAADPRGIEGAPRIHYLDGWNPNGSEMNIAGVGSRNGEVLGLMPHPERAVDRVLCPRGFEPSGRIIFESLASSLREGW